MLQLDHIFVLASSGAPEADALVNIGMVEGSANEHPGQGTSNRRFLLANIMLEFLFVHNIAEAVNGPGKVLKLVDRAIDTDASPFGVVTRWFGEESTPDYPFWEYHPVYFPDPMCFYVGNNSDNFDEPLCICMPPALPVPNNESSANNSDWVLSEAQLCVPAISASETLTRYGKCDRVRLNLGEEHQLKLIFNQAKQGNSMSLRPDLPLVIEW